MAEGAHIRLGREGQAVLGIDLGGLEELLAQGAAELVDVAGQRHPVDLEQHLAGQRVAVGVQARRAHSDDDVARTDPVGAEDLIGLDDADAGRGDVVVTVGHHAGVLRRLATEQRAAGLDAALGDAADDLRPRSGTTRPTAM